MSEAPHLKFGLPARSTPATPAPVPAAHELATAVLLAIRVENALDRWINDDTARSLGEAIADDLADPATRQRVEAFYAELDAARSAGEVQP
jgi:hypothetical protein